MNTSTQPLLVEKGPHDDPYFTGDLEAGKAVFRADLFGDQNIAVREHADRGLWSVELHDGTVAGDGNLRSWGTAPTVDEAWRYLLGAEFGPIDSEYDEDHLRSLLAERSDGLNGVCSDCGNEPHNKDGFCWKSRGPKGFHCGPCCTIATAHTMALRAKLGMGEGQ